MCPSSHHSMAFTMTSIRVHAELSSADEPGKKEKRRHRSPSDHDVVSRISTNCMCSYKLRYWQKDPYALGLKIRTVSSRATRATEPRAAKQRGRGRKQWAGDAWLRSPPRAHVVVVADTRSRDLFPGPLPLLQSLHVGVTCPVYNISGRRSVTVNVAASHLLDGPKSSRRRFLIPQVETGAGEAGNRRNGIPRRGGSIPLRRED